VISSYFRPRVASPKLPALLLVTGTSALSTDTYIAAMPSMRQSLHTTSSVTQLTMTACIGGMALGQLVSGPISDARGRRKMILGACLVFTLMSVLCALATNGWILVAERAVQGAAAGTAVALGRAVVTDRFRGRQAAATFGTLSAVGLIAPVIAPSIGGALLTVGDWRTTFWFLAGVGVAMTLGAALGLPESLPPARRHPGGGAEFRRRTRELLSDRRFSAPVGIQCLTTAGFFVYIGGSSFVMQNGFGLTRGQYTLLFTVNALAMVSSSLLFRILITRTGAVVLRSWAQGLQTTAVVVLFTATVLADNHHPPLAVVWLALSAMTAGLGMYLPANSSIVQNAGRRFSGTSSALGGGLPFLAGALTTPLTGALGSETLMTMASCMVVLFVLAAVAGVVLRRHALEPVDNPDERAELIAAGV
jgi:MFS transporter, DHA1 family, multidrug resistance protein